MWVWLFLSLIILVACVIFAYRMIVSSYDFLPFDKRYFLKFDKNSNDSRESPVNRDGYKVLKSRIQSFEDDTSFYQIQFTKFQERLKTIEDVLAIKNFSPKASAIEEEEDWKELYYKENAAKEKLENELDVLQQKLEEIESEFKKAKEEDWKELYYAENEIKIKIENELDVFKEKLDEAQNKIKENAEAALRLTKIQGEYDTHVNYIHTLEAGIPLFEASISLLQKQLAASVERENELENLLISEIIVREKYSMIRNEYTKLQIEANFLQKRIIEQNQKEMNMEISLTRLSELETKLAICEEEKMKLESRLENKFLG